MQLSMASRHTRVTCAEYAGLRGFLITRDAHGLYRKFGYETACWKNEYEFEPSVLKEYRFDGTAELWKPDDPVSEYTMLYNRFAESFNLAVHRDDPRMLEEHLKGAADFSLFDPEDPIFDAASGTQQLIRGFGRMRNTLLQ